MTKVNISLKKKKFNKKPIKLKSGYEIYVLSENGKEILPFLPLPKATADRFRLKLSSDENIKNIIKVAFKESEPLSVEFAMPDFSSIRQVRGILFKMLEQIDEQIELRKTELVFITVTCSECGEKGLPPPLDYEEGEDVIYTCNECLKKRDEDDDEEN